MKIKIEILDQLLLNIIETDQSILEFVGSDNYEIALKAVEEIKIRYGLEDLTIKKEKNEVLFRDFNNFITYTSIPHRQNRTYEGRDIPDMLKIYFPYEKFNYVQSSAYELAFRRKDNFILSAPTGTGKSEVLLLAILNFLFEKRDRCSKRYTRIHNIIFYIVPMKALAVQAVDYLRKLKIKICVNCHRLDGDYCDIREIPVEEYTGDTDKIPNAKIFLTTPEKLFLNLISRFSLINRQPKLFLIDEIHLLGTGRGIFIEQLISKIREYSLRIVGISATIVNIEEIAKFIDGEYIEIGEEGRSIPVHTQYIGLKNRIRLEKNNEIIYEKTDSARFLAENTVLLDLVETYYESDLSILIFVHRKKDCNFYKGMIASKLNIPPDDIGIHNSSLPRKERLSVEDNFRKYHLKILISTATLSWGVNMPAHIVIIKGTELYDPVLMQMRHLDNSEVKQMIGRAGRSQYIDSREFHNMRHEKTDIKYSFKAHAYVLTDLKNINRYVKGTLLPVRSQLNNRFINFILSLVNNNDYQNIYRAVQRTFLYITKKNHNYEEMIKNGLKILQRDNFISERRTLHNDMVKITYEKERKGLMTTLFDLHYLSVNNILKDPILPNILAQVEFSDIKLNGDERWKIFNMAVYNKCISDILHKEYKNIFREEINLVGISVDLLHRKKFKKFIKNEDKENFDDVFYFTILQLAYMNSISAGNFILDQYIDSIGKMVYRFTSALEFYAK